MLALLLGLALGIAQAGTLYVDGTPVDGLRSFNFEQVDVRVDEQGNIWINTHDKYQVSLGEEAKGKGHIGGGQVAPAEESDLPRGSWWLVTYDHESTGQKVDVLLNGQKVRTVESGGRQTILDISPYLHQGTNVVTFHSYGDAAPGGGAFEILLGPGSIVGSKVSLDRPKISFKRNSASVGGESDHNEMLEID